MYFTPCSCYDSTNDLVTTEKYTSKLIALTNFIERHTIEASFDEVRKRHICHSKKFFSK